jgi:hypothetical protein
MAQVPESKEGQLATVYLDDGSRLFGQLQTITPDTVYLFSAVLGSLPVPQNTIS